MELLPFFLPDGEVPDHLDGLQRQLAGWLHDDGAGLPALGIEAYR